MKSSEDWRKARTLRGRRPGAVHSIPSGDERTEARRPEAGEPVAPRVVASVIDPLVREDGVGEPVLFVRSESGAQRLSSSPRAAHPVRERLLAKAREASARSASSPPPAMPAASTDSAAQQSGSDADAPDSEARDAPPRSVPLGVAVARELGDVARFDAVPELADDLDLIGAPERPRASARTSPPLGAPASLVLTALVGITVMAVLFGLLHQLAPRPPLVARQPPPSAVPAPPPEVTTLPPVAPPEPPKRAPRPPPKAVWRVADAAQEPGVRFIEADVGQRPLSAGLQNAGISRRDAYRIIHSFSGVKNLNRTRPRDHWSALLDGGTGRLTAFEYTVSDEEVYQARENAAGLLVAKALDLEVRRERVDGVIVVQGSLEASAARAGFEPGLTEVVNKALAGYTTASDMKSGDVLALVVQEVSVLGRFSRYAGVEALEYRPVGGEPVRVYYHQTDKVRGYVDARGRTFGRSRWARPVPGAAVTSRYNPRRFHPILKRIKPHNGTDFGAPLGTPVLAAGSGQVRFVGRAGPNGNMVMLSHPGGYTTGYSHLLRFARGLRVGQKVEQKQPIGYVGSTGRSTGPHLHFSAKKGGRFIDPESLNLDAFSRLPMSDRHTLAELRERYDRRLDALHPPEARPLPSSEPAQPGPVASPPAPSVAAFALEGAPAPVTSAPAEDENAAPAEAAAAEAPATIGPPEHDDPGDD